LVAIEGSADGLPQAIAGALCGLAQYRLELGEGLFDRVEVLAIGRQVDELRALRGDRLGDAAILWLGLGGFAPESQVRTELAAGGRRIRTVGPANAAAIAALVA
jgi:hypothetical protein